MAANDEWANLATNVILPFDPRRTKLLLGSLEYIAFEVLVAKLIRKIMKADNVGWARLAYIHALSLPFMGGAAGFFDPQSNYEGNDSKGKKIEFGTRLADGAKGIPAVILAQWILESFNKGFHAPWFNMKDLLITAGSKTITRPLTAIIIPYLPEDMQDNYELIHAVIEKQATASNLRSKPTEDARRRF